MSFIHSDLGSRLRGDIVEITLKGNAANVRLLDSSNFQSYRNGRQHRFVGGLAKSSPVRLAIPNSGHWHVAVDMQGLVGKTNASIRVLPRALPPLQEAPLSSVPSLVQGRTPDNRPLASALLALTKKTCGSSMCLSLMPPRTRTM